MDALTSPAARSRAVEFKGRWQDFLAMAAVNLVLTIVTLGIYRFWAKARVRRYLWSHTRIIDDQLEWTGTGGEMFVGFLMVAGVLLAWTVLLFGGSALVGQWFMVVGALAFYIFVLWAFGFAQFRALRYRLSRTYWRGIRGGSPDNGVGYGWTALGNNFVAGLTLGILTPRAIANNWNDRVRAMSFGPHMLDSNVDTEGLQSRWMMIYGIYAAFFAINLAFESGIDPAEAVPDTDQTTALLLVAAPLTLALGLALVLTSFWALFFRKAAETFRMGELHARLPIRTVDWLKFYAKLAALTVVTLGLGVVMWSYFRWKFVMDRLELYGFVDLDELTQSTTQAPRDAEGFAEAFDIGSF